MRHQTSNLKLSKEWTPDPAPRAVDPSPTGLYLPSYYQPLFHIPRFFHFFLLFEFIHLNSYVIMHPRCACFVLAVTITVCLQKMWLCVPSFCRSSWMERNKGNLSVNCSPLIECDVGISGSQLALILSLQGHCCSQDTSVRVRVRVTFTHISPTLNSFAFFWSWH